MSLLRALAFVAAMAFFVILAAPAQALARRMDSPFQQWMQKFFCRTMCRIIGIEVVANGGMSGGSPRFVVANHVSWTDIIAIASLYPLTFLAKAEVARWPVLGFLARLQGTVFVDRAHRSAIPKVNAALAEELRQGRDIVVFAEGTSSDGANVLKFNASHFAMLSSLARGEDGCAAAVIPAAFLYAPRGEPGGNAESFDVGWYGDMSFVPHLWTLMRRGGARCHILFGEPLHPSSFADRKTLAQTAQNCVRRLLEEGFRARASGIMIIGDSKAH
jgi:1-acyl-sn-glycerol-3-phosphate acyltransferase